MAARSDMFRMFPASRRFIAATILNLSSRADICGLHPRSIAEALAATVDDSAGRKLATLRSPGEPQQDRDERCC